MGKLGPIATTIAATTFALSAQAADPEIIDSPKYADRISTSIIDACQIMDTNEGKQNCITAGVTASFTIATTMGQYIDEVVAPVKPFEAGLAKGDLIGSCFSPVDNFSNRDYSNMSNYLDAAFNVVKSCEQSMDRAGDEIGINYQPTARNTASCHMNQLNGYTCEY